MITWFSFSDLHRFQQISTMAADDQVTSDPQHELDVNAIYLMLSLQLLIGLILCLLFWLLCRAKVYPEVKLDPDGEDHLQAFSDSAAGSDVTTILVVKHHQSIVQLPSRSGDCQESEV